MARQNTTAAAAASSVPAPAPAAAQDNSYNMPPAQSNGTQHVANLNPPYTFPSTTQSVNVPAPAVASFGSQPQAQSHGAQNLASNSNISVGAAAPTVPPVAMNPDLQRQILLLKTLADAGVPQDQWGGIIAALTQTQAASPAAVGNGANASLPPPSQYGAVTQQPPVWTSRPDESRDHNGHNENVRSPQGRYRRRSRSQSPGRGWKTHESPSSRRRDESHYGDHGRNSPGYGRDEHARGRHNDYRQRSPIRRGRSSSPPRGFYDGRSGGEKWIDFDPSIPKGSIKGLPFVHNSK